MIDKSALERMESIGDNCELGLVLRHHGHESGGFFRWTLCPIESAIALLRNSFHGAFDYGNLVPHSRILVRDKQTGIAFHSKMHSIDTDRKWEFAHSEEERREIYESEAEKVLHLARKFHARARNPDTIFVVKKNHAGLTRLQVDSLVEALSSYSGGVSPTVLWVRAAEQPEQVSTVERLSGNILAGYLSRFAPYRDAKDFELTEWNNLINKATLLGAILQIIPWGANLANVAYWT